LPKHTVGIKPTSVICTGLLCS